ncbi:ceramide synthase 4-like [Gracilinanus agilis]|uniref:ceramide synthase 4-like n=1 Tax=Gracilinanus agilis TaxID=191870 RepID=UPI001CFD0748|nr:ceramide synthase 4-like [Gracilinanus agilis]
MLSNLYQWFWKDEHWLPSGYTWTDIEDVSGVTYPHPKDLLATLPLAFILVIVRYSFERTIGVLLSRVMGVRDYLRLKPGPNPILESFFQTQSWNPKEAQLSRLASQCDLSVRQTQRWFRRRRNQERPNLTKKFCESSWRLFFYLSSSFGIFLTIYDEKWFGDPKTCFDRFPKQPLKTGLYCWYLLEMSFYLSLLLTLPFDVKRKDTMAQVIHHFVAIILMFLSYCCNLLPFGALTLLLHDTTDILLEASKMLLYAHWKHACEIVFAIFAVMFIVTRLILFPTKIIYVSFYYFTWNLYFGYIFSLFLLTILQGLHVFWSYFILHISYLRIIYNKKSDLRSDVEEQDTSDEQLEKMEKQKNRRLQTNEDTNSYNILWI